MKQPLFYSDVERVGFLPKKNKYTLRDVKAVIRDRRLSISQARFTVICSAIHHNTEFSRTLIDKQIVELRLAFGG
jgi:hypothetical protein